MTKELHTHSFVFNDIKLLIEQAKEQVAITVNSTMSMLYWEVGNRVLVEVLKDKRAEYGKQVIISLSEQLTKEYGNGWSDKQLRHCIRFAEVFSEKEIVYTVCRQLSWSHLRIIFFIEEPLKREFYIEMCKLEKWSVRTLREK